MIGLPRVTSATRERVSRELDDLGPAACTDQVVENLRRSNPELLDIASRCARDVRPAAKTMLGLAMFCRLLMAETAVTKGGSDLKPLPRVAPETRDLVVSDIDRQGT